MEPGNELLTYLLSSGGGASAVAGAAFMAYKRLVARIDKCEEKIDKLETNNAKLEARFEYLNRGK